MNSCFSDRDNRKIPQTTHVSDSVWQGIVAVIDAFIDAFIRDDSLSHDFPLLCPDGRGICGMDEYLFKRRLRAVIPKMDYPFPSIDDNNPWEDETEKKSRIETEQYAVLDTIEFIYAHLHDAVYSPNRYHEFFRHFELEFKEDGESKVKFRDSIDSSY